MAWPSLSSPIGLVRRLASECVVAAYLLAATGPLPLVLAAGPLAPRPRRARPLQGRPRACEMSSPQLGRSDLQLGDDTAEFLADVIESSTERSIVAIDADGVIVLWNEGARRFYGYESSEIVGQSWTLLHSQEDVQADVPGEVMRCALRDGKWQGTMRRLRKDRSDFTARVVVTPRAGTSDEPGGFVVISSDITAEERHTQELARAESYTRSFLECAPDAMVIVNSTGEIRVTNVETERLFGYTRDELIGFRVEMLIPPRFHHAHPTHRAAFFVDPQTRPMGAGLELFGRRKDGAEFPVEISLSPMESDEGLLATASIRDVTKQKLVEHRLREANIQLEGANRAKDKFLANMSHELRTPLNAILGFTGTLLMKQPGPLNSEQERQLGVVRTNSRHLLSLINDLLDLARIESGKMKLTIEEIDCEALLDDVAVALHPLAEERGIELTVEPPMTPTTVRCDRRAIRQILINLANNAIKFTDHGGVSLTLSRHEREASTILAVADTGRGIKAEDQRLLFEAFEQFGAKDATPYEGAGLGLHICQTLAAAVGASISFQSELGVGSTFSLELPD
jgi:PAS domain S-box-containing protein